MKKRIVLFLIIFTSFFLLVSCIDSSDDLNDNNNGDTDNGTEVNEFDSAVKKFEDNNYEVKIDVLGYGDLITSNTMSFDGNFSKYEDENYIEIYERDNTNIIVYTKVGEEWIKSSTEIDINEQLNFYKNFTKNMFELTDGKYTLTDKDDMVVMGFVNELDFDLDINTIELESLKITIENNSFKMIDMRININSYIYTINLHFSNFGNVTINAPK